ncbi:MAG: N-acetyltransferase [Pseudomonadota bacterium]
MLVRDAITADVEGVVDLLENKRLELEAWEPRFWRKSSSSTDISKAFLSALIEDEHSTLLVAEVYGSIVGCLQFKPTFVPPVYDPSGTTWMVDDFVVSDGDWSGVGAALLKELRVRTIDKSDGQLVFPVPVKDTEARKFFEENGLNQTTTWWTASS